jgi:molybdopterin synthase catalytic subunit
MRTAIVDAAIDITALLHEVSGPAVGATVLFVGTVRDFNEGRPVTGIEYSTYRAMAERELKTIVEEASRRFETEAIVAEHRVGELAIGDASVAIAVAHERRGQAYEASRFIIEELKSRLPVWKLELYTDGTREWVNASGVERAASGNDAGAGVAANETRNDV